MSIYRGRTRKEFYLAALLYDAIDDRDFTSVKSLLTEKGADPNLVLPKKGIAPFHLVIGCDDYEFALKVVVLILQNGGNPNVRSDDGLTPLHIAAAWGRHELLRLLLNSGGDPEAKDASRLTPLYYAHQEDHPDCLQLLRDYYPVKSVAFVKEEEERDAYQVVFDKILIDNGTSIGEYEVVEDPNPNSITKKEPNLQLLPQQPSTTEYVMDWFDKHVRPAATTFENIPKSTGSSTPDTVDSFESSVDESDDEKSLPTNPEKITFRKMYRKTRKVHNCKNCTPKKASPELEKTLYLDVTNKSNNATKYLDAEEFTKLDQLSRESGIVTIQSVEKDLTTLIGADNPTRPIDAPKQEAANDKSSDYLTCSLNSLDKNVFDITEDVTNNVSNLITSDESKRGSAEAVQANQQEVVNVSNDQSFISVSEVYKYVDKDEGIVLYERRLIKTASECAGSVKSSSISSKLSSLPETIDYDTDTLRKELSLHGYVPGPITDTTKRVYLRKLHHLKKYPVAVKQDVNVVAKRAYSIELEKTLRDPTWRDDITAYKSLEEALGNQFGNPDPTRKWRGGLNKSSFTYLLLDPRVTNNLPCRAETMPPKEIWETFLGAIFYVGKGKRSRPYQHLYDAVNLWKRGQESSSSTKIQRILDIWRGNGGVICLHVFQNIIPVEAFTREASMISALKLENLTNAKSGEFYGVAATWPQKQRKMLGVYLLYKAMMIFLNEGERQLCPADIE